MARCPRCFSKISDFATGEETLWTDDPIKTPKGEAGEPYKGFTYITPAHIEELQQTRQQQEEDLGFIDPETTGYVEGTDVPKTTFTPVRVEGKRVYFYKKHLRELRESTEKILEATGQIKETYFNYDEEGTEYNIGNHQLDWKDVDLTQKFLDIKAVHIEDLRHYLIIGWFEDFKDITPFNSLSHQASYILEKPDETASDLSKEDFLRNDYKSSKINGQVSAGCMGTKYQIYPDAYWKTIGDATGSCDLNYQNYHFTGSAHARIEFQEAMAGAGYLRSTANGRSSLIYFATNCLHPSDPKILITPNTRFFIDVESISGTDYEYFYGKVNPEGGRDNYHRIEVESYIDIYVTVKTVPYYYASFLRARLYIGHPDETKKLKVGRNFLTFPELPEGYKAYFFNDMYITVGCNIKLEYLQCYHSTMQIDERSASYDVKISKFGITSVSE